MKRIYGVILLLLSFEWTGYASTDTLLLPAVAKFIEQYPDTGTMVDCQPATESLFGVKQRVTMKTGEFDFYISGGNVATILRVVDGIPELVYKNPSIKESGLAPEEKKIPESSVYPALSQPSSRPSSNPAPGGGSSGVRYGIPMGKDSQRSGFNYNSNPYSGYNSPYYDNSYYGNPYYSNPYYGNPYYSNPYYTTPYPTVPNTAAPATNYNPYANPYQYMPPQQYYPPLVNRPPVSTPKPKAK